MSTAYELGKTQHGEGRAPEQNPYTSGTEDSAAWSAGWTDAKTAAADAAPTDKAPAALVKDDAQPDAQPDVEGVEGSLGDAGYARILELLADPPLGADDKQFPGFPPDGEAPEDLDDWLKAFKQPLAFLTVDAAIGAVTSRVNGTERGRLKSLYAGMRPMEVAAVMSGNADTIAGFADARVAEAGLIVSMQAMVTQKAAGYLLSALALL